MGPTNEEKFVYVPGPTSTKFSLTAEQCHEFEKQSYLGPLKVDATLDAEPERKFRSLDYCDELFEFVGKKEEHIHNPHLRNKCVYDLVTRPEVLDRIENLLGPDIMLWRTHCFVKGKSNEAQVPWHQDSAFWDNVCTADSPRLPPGKDDLPVTMTAWIAITPCTPITGCLNLLPESVDNLPHVKHDMTGMQKTHPIGTDMSTLGGADAVRERSKKMVLAPGEMFFFHERTLHQSNPNLSDTDERVGIAARFIRPSGRLTSEKSYAPMDLQGTPLLVVRGELGEENVADWEPTEDPTGHGLVSVVRKE